MKHRRRKIDPTDRVIREQLLLFGRVSSTQQEMADWFGCSVSTIGKYMSDKGGEFYLTYAEGNCDTKMKLRQRQLEKALDGDNSMLVWLGKNMLNQKDKQEQDITTSQRIVVIDSDDEKL